MLPTDPYYYATNCKPGEDWQGSRTCNAWPNSGEIDIMEHVGFDHGHVHATVHTRGYYFINNRQRKASIGVDDVDKSFHIYAIEWTPERIDVFVDDVPYFSYLNQGEGWKAWPRPYSL